MTLRTILAVFSNEADVVPLTQSAIGLTGDHGTHLIGCHAEPSQFAMMSASIDVPDTATIQALYAEADRRMRVIGEAFKAKCKAEDLSHEWRPMKTPGGDSAASALGSARSADIVLMRQKDPAAGEDTSTDVEAMLFESGRPVLFIPPHFTISAPPERILIAWDGSREATRALFDALEMIKAAKDVEILIVDPEKLPDIDQPLPGIDIANSLSRHGVHAEVTAVASAEGSAYATIVARASAFNADLIVMGAYTHARVRQWLFGGVTREIMDRSEVPVLMSR